MSHVFSPDLVMDADFGYTRQVTGAQSLLDLKLGDYGLDTLKIPGTNGQLAPIMPASPSSRSRRQHVCHSRQRAGRQSLSLPR